MALSGAADNKTELHVTGFNPGADADKAHHMLLYTCDEPLKAPGEVYDCLHHRSVRAVRVSCSPGPRMPLLPPCPPGSASN